MMTVPLPDQVPVSDFTNSASSANAGWVRTANGADRAVINDDFIGPLHRYQ